MFGLFSRKQAEPDMVYDQAVIIEIDFAGFDDYGTQEQRKAIKSLEEQLEESLSLPSGVDGDEFGDGQATIYLYGPSADEILKKIQSTLKKSPFQHIAVTLQYGLPDDPNTKEEKFTF